MQHMCIISESGGNKRPFSLDDYFNDTFRWRAYNLYWISGITVSHLTSAIPSDFGSINLHLRYKLLGSLSIILVPADKEYLHKARDGNVFLHNAETEEESLYLSNSTFVIYLYFKVFS